ncbi:hypothetical protein [Nocardia nova]|uniref:NADH:flavin oxidoreductase/NADH oxidase N-terminal domain-containing protein n=1 Tax=Nocardia nova TaxID=37330 RepID=A0A2S6AAY6_9NOCA|nr:hypothetical protein [Nocardia nova]PPJ30649.1 hypothetical protein C5F51_09375 [Nocardia nova]
MGMTQKNPRVQVGGYELQSPYGLAPLNTALIGGSSSSASLGLAFYREMCSSMLGLLTIGGLAISPDGRANRHAFVLDRSANTRLLSDIIGMAHENGVRVAVQLEHAGRQTTEAETGRWPVAAWELACSVTQVVPRMLSVPEIRVVVQSFADSAVIAASAGADFIEVHAAHGYLLSGFLSAYSNQRSDEYGGSTENRFRILVEIVAEILSKAAVPVGVRVNVLENEPDGQTVEQVIEGLSPLSDQLAYVSVSAGMYRTENDLIMPSRNMGENLWSRESHAIKTGLSVPTLLAGNITTVDAANAVLTAGHADIALFGRGLLADPHLIDKYYRGEASVRCTDCGLCKYKSHGFPHIYCPLNHTLRRSVSPVLIRNKKRE